MVRDYPKGVWFIGLLFLAVGGRGKGLGKQLVDSIAASVSRSGGEFLHVVVQKQNVRARAFWEREQVRFHSEQPLFDHPKNFVDMLNVALNEPYMVGGGMGDMDF